MPETENRRKRAWGRVKSLCFYAFLLAAIAAAFVVSSGGGAGDAPRSLMGYSVMSVLTESIQPVLPKGCVVLVRTVDPLEIRQGDDVTYLREDNSTVTHRVVGIVEDREGLPRFRTQGVDNPLPDPELVRADNVIGKVVWHSALLGQAAALLRLNWMFAVIFAALLLALAFTLRVFFTSGPKRLKRASPALSE